MHDSADSSRKWAERTGSTDDAGCSENERGESLIFLFLHLTARSNTGLNMWLVRQAYLKVGTPTADTRASQ